MNQYMRASCFKVIILNSWMKKQCIYVTSQTLLYFIQFIKEAENHHTCATCNICLIPIKYIRLFSQVFWLTHVFKELSLFVVKLTCNIIISDLSIRVSSVFAYFSNPYRLNDKILSKMPNLAFHRILQ